MEENFWPSFGEIPEIITPVSILIEQAAFLEKSAFNLLKGEVASRTVRMRIPSGAIKQKMEHRFRIIAPFLGDYVFTLLKVEHDPIFMYPCSLTFTPKGVSYNVSNEAQLRNALKEVITDETTIDTIKKLIAQSKSNKGNNS